MLFTNSKPYVGFDDRPLIVAGVLINSLVAISIFYRSAVFKVPFFSFLYKSLEYLIVISLIWIVLRTIFLHNKIQLPGPENRKKRWLRLPILLVPFLLIIYGYIRFIQPNLNFVMPGYQSPSMFSILVTGFTMLVIDVSVYAILTYIYELNAAKLVQEELKKQNAVNQLKALKNQLSPHFLFNSLNALIYLIEDDKEKSKEFVHQLAYLYNKIHEFSNQDLITLTDELDYLSAYMGLLKKRYGSSIDFEVRIPDEQLNQKIVPLSIQLGVENAVKHNSISNKNALHISILGEQDHVLVKNKIRPKEKEDESWGVGIQNMKKRYRILTEKTLSSEIKNGVFTLKIPLLGFEPKILETI